MGRKYSLKDLIKIAIEEHLKCTEFPLVGAVIAKDGGILSTGYRGERKGVAIIAGGVFTAFMAKKKMEE